MNLSAILISVAGYNSLTFFYSLFIVFLLAFTWLLLKKTGHNPFGYILAEVIYGALAGYLALKTGTDLFQVMQFLAIGGFLGGPILLLMNAFFAYKKFKAMAILNSVLATILVLVGIDAFVIEPHFLEISRYEIASDKIDTPLNIAIIADLQTDSVGDYERDVFQKIAAEKPDIALFPGDYIQVFTNEERVNQTAKLKKIIRDSGLRPKYGSFSVQGNVDYTNWPEIFSDLPGKAFVKTETVSAGPVDITGLSFDEGRFKYEFTARNKFQIGIAHYPDFALGNGNADLMVAGHCHGGQVQIPFVGPIVTFSNVPKAWVNGNLVQLPNRSHLIVSRGVGMERMNAPRLRFCCRPQLIFVKVIPKDIEIGISTNPNTAAHNFQ